ncbi:hypothetical protein NWP22_02040 [Anabaenopsis tanganyikae CS-531]|uniref:Uncharacterized protein n=2 Tax=Anabaenopsis TaxID=110103 RepID=A0ABT6K9Y9_9CYAN|nr:MULTISPECIES: hypothetical protein [Anabaenopsis]MDB9539415.1 hypothetical protein [Anabaenopsis arnoldii]MDH6091720.1 hypothetical protein [Anabaenopsis arnoldii]MDH6097466.1 hypothetical protein [Anabaenopsis sp. FSS-46]MDH6104670.1 hypothetical protein [Anabaenopsis tanganyikae CS-531]
MTNVRKQVEELSAEDGSKCIFLHHHYAYRVFWDDWLNNFWFCSAIPGTIWVDHHYRSTATNPQEIGCSLIGCKWETCCLIHPWALVSVPNIQD